MASTVASTVASAVAASKVPSAVVPPLGSGMVDSELLDLWNTETDLNKRDAILSELERRNLFPATFQADWERITGAINLSASGISDSYWHPISF